MAWKFLLLLSINSLLVITTYCQRQQLQQEEEDDGFYTLELPPVKVTKKDISEFQEGLRKFSGALYFKISRLTKNSRNIIFSPASISHAMGMVNAGAKGNTSKEIRRSFRVDSSTTTPKIDALFREVTKDKFGGKKKNRVVSIMASRSYFAPNYLVYGNYTDILEDSYYSGLDEVDFNENYKAAKKINTWVEDQTNGLIKNLISPDLFTPLTKFVLVNALYFKAPWLQTFGKTSEMDFKTPTGMVKAPFLKSYRSQYQMEDTSDSIRLAIPYEDEETFFIIIMPKTEKAMEEFSKQKTLESTFKNLDKSLKKWKLTKINLLMPEFTVEQKLDIKKVLKTMGIKTLFDNEAADLSGISKQYVYVTDFVHKAKINVNKDGTEAAAASGVVGGARSLFIAPEVHINRPFVYAIYERGNVLFIGRMVNPSGK